MSSTHPQVEAYLDDLARMLADIDPGERDDILASVREHLDAEIAAGHGSDAVVNATLLRLGPPEQVAAAARTNTSGAVRRTSGLIRVASLATALATLPGLLLMLWVKVTGLRQAGVTPLEPGWPEEVSLFALNGVEALYLMLFCARGWLRGPACPVPSEGPQRRTRQRLIWAGPTGFFAVLVTLQPEGPSIVGAFALLVLVVAIAAVGLACRAAWREAENPVALEP